MKKDKLPLWAQYLLPLGFLAAAYKIYKLYKAGKDEGNEIAKSIVDDAKTKEINKALNETGIAAGSTRAQQLQNIADEIYNCLYKDGFFGLTEDEEGAINEFNKCIFYAEAKAVAMLYKTGYNKSLYGDLNKYTNATQKKLLKTSLFNYIKNV